jgi:hypothetical protein
MKVEGEDNHLAPWWTTTNFIIVIYGGDIKYQCEIVCTETQGNNLRKTWLLHVNVIQKF